MNNPDNVAVDVKEERAWLKARKQSLGLSWSAIEKESGIPSGTLSLFASDSYAGNNENVAVKIFRYRQKVELQAERAVGLPELPPFIATPTAMRIRGLLVLAQRGGITVAATGPGTSKTMTMDDYRASVANVWVATMKPTTKTLAAMTTEVLRAIGGEVKNGWVRQMSAQVQSLVIGKGGLIVIDEANHLDFESIEEIRAWHDLTGVGICLLGNEELIATIRGGARGHAFSRLNSRITASHLQDLPQREDIDMYLDAWGVTEETMRHLLMQVGRTPGNGGLREIRQLLECACMYAHDDGQALSMRYVHEAIASRSTRVIQVKAA